MNSSKFQRHLWVLVLTFVVTSWVNIIYSITILRCKVSFSYLLSATQNLLKWLPTRISCYTFHILLLTISTFNTHQCTLPLTKSCVHKTYLNHFFSICFRKKWKPVDISTWLQRKTNAISHSFTHSLTHTSQHNTHTHTHFLSLQPIVSFVALTEATSAVSFRFWE